MNSEFPLTYNDEPRDAVQWLNDRGYRALAVTPAPGCVPGVVFTKGQAPPRFAVIGETLVYAAGKVTVK